MCVDRLQQEEEVSTMFWKFLKVFVDHLQCTLKHSIKYLWNVFCYVALKYKYTSFVTLWFYLYWDLTITNITVNLTSTAE